MSRHILNDDAILELLGDSRNSELSDFSDEENNEYQSREFDLFLENYNNFNYDNEDIYNIQDDIITQDNEVENMIEVSTYAYTHAFFCVDRTKKLYTLILLFYFRLYLIQLVQSFN